MMCENYKFSVITVCYNSEKYIERCISSVQKQTYNNIEHIIIDGGSTDNTTKIVKSVIGDNVTFISEPDNGIYDAMNKGLKYVTGDVVLFLNSDDFLINEEIINRVMSEFNNDNELEVLVAGIAYFDNSDINTVIRKWQLNPNLYIDFTDGWHPPHPGFFAKTKCYDEVGNFDIDLKVAADFDLMLRFIQVRRFKLKIISELSTMMFDGGFSSSFKNRIQGNLNVLKSFKKYDITINPLVYLFKRLKPKVISRVKAYIYIN